jgi:predicted AAA+ superfamily ATPase
VRDLKNIGDLEQFTRFVRSCAARTSQVLNLSVIADDVDISVKTAKSWLSVLEASFQVFILRPYFSNRLKRLVKAPKLYFLDTGFCCYLTRWVDPQVLQNGAMAGALFETFVVVELLKRYWNHLRNAPLHYYRDREKREIDVVVEESRMLHPFEIKLGATPRSEWVESFRCLRGSAQGGVICQVDSVREIRNRVYALPWTVL